METYLMGWFHAVVVILIVAIISGLVIALVKVHKLETRIRDLQFLIDNIQIIMNNNLKEVETDLSTQIENTERALESSIDSRINKLENRIKTEK